MGQSNKIIRLCNRCIRREREKYDQQIHMECMQIRMEQWDCQNYFCKIQDDIRIGRHIYPIDIIDYKEEAQKEVLYISGTSLWQKNTPKEGEVAFLPLYLINYDAENQKFKTIAKVITEKDTGYFCFEVPLQQGEFYLAYRLDDVNISICKISGMVTGHDCLLCFQARKVQSGKTYSQIRCRNENIVEEHFFKFAQNKKLFNKINPILNE